VCLVALVDRVAVDLGGAPVDDVLGVRRISFPLDYWNAVGAWSAMTLALLLGCSAHARSPAARAFALGSMPAVAAVAYLTYSRAAIVAVLAGAVTVTLAARFRWLTLAHGLAAGVAGALVIAVVRSQPEIAEATGMEGGATVVAAVVVAGAVCALVAIATAAAGLERARLPARTGRVAGIAAAGLAAVVVALAAVAYLPDAWESFKTPYGRTGADPAARLANLNGNRYEIWSSSVDAFRADPLRGIGAGTFEFWWNQDARDPEFLRDAHSLYLEMAAELGVPGLLLVLIAVLGALLAGVRARTRPSRSRTGRGLIGAGVAGFAAWAVAAGVDWMWEATAVTVLALVVVSCVVAADGTRQAPLSAPTRVAAVIASLVVLLAHVPGLVSASQLRSSERAAAAGDVAGAFARAEDALRAAPWRSEPYLQRALLAESVGELRAARRDMMRAAERDSADWRIPLLLSRVEAQRGRPRAALRAFRQARERRPLAGIFERLDAAPTVRQQAGRP